jgi:hypothetical protein
LVSVIYALFCDTWSTGCFMNTPNLVLCLTLALFTSTVNLFQGWKVWCWWSMCYFVNTTFAWWVFCEHYNFDDLFGTCFVMFFNHLWSLPMITWGLHCKFGKQWCRWFICSFFVLISWYNVLGLTFKVNW